ncbi:11398_t:CDS:1, partial [Gigaspora rosea]
FSLDKLYEIVTKIQNDKWDDDTIEMPFIPNSLLKIIGKTELKDESSKLIIKEEAIQKLIQELKNIFEKETDKKLFEV